MHKTRNQIIIALVINIVLPYLAYTLLLPHTSNLTALSVAAVIPLLDTLYSLIRERKFGAFSGFIFLGLLLGMIAVLLGGDARFILLRESYVTGILGLVFLGSLLTRRPLIFHFADRFTGRDTQLNEKWQQLPGLRRSFRLMTCVWGLVLAMEACAKVPLAYTLSVPTFLVVGPIFTYGVIGLTILWNISYVKRLRSRAASGPKPILPEGR